MTLVIKFLIVLAYYNRPNLVKRALESISLQTYNNWELAFIDDNSPAPGKPIVESQFSQSLLNKCTFYKSERTLDYKLKNESDHGDLINKAIIKFHIDINNIHNNISGVIVILCDDDLLIPDYLSQLNNYYINNPGVKYSYCRALKYNPLKEKLDLNNISHLPTLGGLHDSSNSIKPQCVIDSCQVTFKSECIDRCRYHISKTSGQDAHIFGQLYRFYKLCPYNNIVGQIKGCFIGQLSNQSPRTCIYNTVDSKE